MLSYQLEAKPHAYTPNHQLHQKSDRALMRKKANNNKEVNISVFKEHFSPGKHILCICFFVF